MAKRGKKYREACKLFDRSKLYTLEEACDLVKKTSYSKMKASVDLAVNLGVDPRHADQNIRGATPLPHGLGKSVRIVVFAKGEKAAEAGGLNLEFVGADDLAKKINDGWLDFDHVISTPDMMGTVGRLGKVLGPRGLRSGRPRVLDRDQARRYFDRDRRLRRGAQLIGERTAAYLATRIR